MTQPVVVDLPHRLGAEEAKRRIARGIGRLGDHIPGGAEVESAWTADRLDLRVRAIGQEVTAAIHVFATTVRVELTLPGALGLFAKSIEKLLRRQGAELLEDRSGGKQA